jgi:hypothetical protein
MPALKIDNFTGAVPRTGPTQLEGNQAQTASNIKLQSKELRSWRKPVKVYEPATPDIRTIYKLEGPAGAFRWLTWNTDVDVVAGPVADFSDYRVYYTGDGAPKKTNYNLASGSGSGTDPFPDSWLYMGVPNPTGAPTLSASSSTAPAEVRAYVYTYVSTFGTVKEESGPSPATTVTVSTAGASVTVSGFSAPPTTGYNITHIRIYRTITGASDVVYSFVTEIPVATASFIDSKTAVQLGETLSTINFVPPLSDLKGLVAMPNGMLAAFRDNEVWFCEPYLPHAWPAEYMMTVEHKIVGLGVYDTTLVVMTEKFPYLMTGTSPLAVSETKLPLAQPCASKRSIASDQYGVLYASPNGLVSIGAGSQDVITTPLYTRDEWQELIPSSMLGVIYNNLYICFHNSPNGIEAIVIARGDIPPLSFLSFDARAVYIERTTGNIYALSQFDNYVYQIDSDPINNTIYEWKSKKFVMPSPLTYAVLKVQADYEYLNSQVAYNQSVALIKQQNEALFAAAPDGLGGNLNDKDFNDVLFNGSILTTIPTQADLRNIQVIFYADEKQVHAVGVTSQEPLRLPVMPKAYVWELEVTGNVPVRSIVVGTSIAETKLIS